MVKICSNSLDILSEKLDELTTTCSRHHVLRELLKCVWIHSDEELNRFIESCCTLCEKYLTKCSIKPKDTCKDIVLDYVLQHKHGHNLESLMTLIHFVKVFQMNTGKFMQELLGSFPGWVSLPDGHPSGLDLYNNETQTYVEIKNRYNTDNASAKQRNLEKLATQIQTGHKAIYGVINDKTKAGIEKKLYHKGKAIEYLSGDALMFKISGIKGFSDILGKIIMKLIETEDEIKVVAHLP